MLRVEDAIATVPEETALVAHAAFPNGNVYLWIRDELGQIYQDKVISSKEHTIDVGAHRDAPLQVNDKSDQNLVKIFLEIT